MKKVLIDTSVIIKWYKTVGEEKVIEARRFLKEHIDNKLKICVSQLTILELLNQAILDVHFLEEQWRKIIEDFFLLSLEIIFFDKKLSDEIYKIGRQYRLPAYDASYIAIAKKLQIDFITADIKLVKKVNLPFVKAI